MEAGIAEQSDVRSVASRIDRMHQGDRWGAMAFVCALWATMLFVLFTMWPLVEDGMIGMVLAIAAVLVLAFNTAAIVAMLRHYHNDKAFIYGLDIKHLDEMRRRKRR